MIWEYLMGNWFAMLSLGNAWYWTPGLSITDGPWKNYASCGISGPRSQAMWLTWPKTQVFWPQFWVVPQFLGSQNSQCEHITTSWRVLCFHLRIDYSNVRRLGKLSMHQVFLWIGSTFWWEEPLRTRFHYISGVLEGWNHMKSGGKIFKSKLTATDKIGRKGIQK